MPDKDPVERLKGRLYSRGAAPQVNPAARSPLPAGFSRTPRSWDGGAKEEAAASISIMTNATRKRSAAFFFFWGSLAFFVIAAGVAAYALLGGVNTISPQNIDVEIVAPSLVDSGQGATLQYIIHNRNTTALLSADLVIDYPDGTRSQNDPTVSLPHERIAVGTIEPGQQIKQTSSALFFGAEGAQNKITATLEYQVAASNAVFVKSSDVFFTIGSAPVSVRVDAPSEAIAGQPFDIELSVSSNATAVLENVAIQAQYPFGFSVASASPEPAHGGVLWRLGQMAPGSAQTIRITGALVGEDGDERVFHFLAGTQSDQTETSIRVPILSSPLSMVIHKPFIATTVYLNGASGAVVPAALGESIQGTVSWTNNLAESVSDLSFTLSLRGSAIDPSSVTATNGFYDSNKNRIVWDAKSDTALSSAEAGKGGILQFSFATYPPSKSRFVNPEASLDLSVHASRQGAVAVENITSAAATKVQFASAVSLAASGLHFSGPFGEVGPMPPVAGKTTTYAVVLSLKNSSNTIAGGTVTTVLPSYVEYVSASAQGGESVSYDAATRTVTWSLGDVRAGIGYATSPRQATFRIAFTPSVSQANSVPQLTGPVRFVGQDRFAQTAVAASAPAVTTKLDFDSGFSRGMEIVGQ